MSAEDLTLDQLEVFRAAAAAGSFSAAARRLGRAQSAVSYAIARLEQALGVELFDRGGRTPVLTAAGQGLLGDAHAVELQVGELRARARSMATGIEPTVSIAIDVFLEKPLLLELLRGFRSEYQHSSLRLYTESLGAIAELVAGGTCGLGVSGTVESWPSGLVVTPLTSIGMVAVVAAEHPLAASGEVVSRAALQQHTQIVLTDRSALTAGVDRGVVSGRTWRVADLRTKLELIEAGFGWGSLPEHMIRDRLERRPVWLTEQHRADARSARRDEGVGFPPRTEEQRGDAQQMRDLATEAKPVGALGGALVPVRSTVHPEGGFRVPLYTIHRADDPPGPAGRWLLERLEAMCAGRAPMVQP